MVVVDAANDVDVQRDARGLRERLEHVRDHFAAEVADLLAHELEVAAEVRPRGDVEHGAREGLRGGKCEKGQQIHNKSELVDG